MKIKLLIAIDILKTVMLFLLGFIAGLFIGYFF